MLGTSCNGAEVIKCVKREDGEFRNAQIEGLERRTRRFNKILILIMSKREEGTVLKHDEDYHYRHNISRMGN